MAIKLTEFLTGLFTGAGTTNDPYSVITEDGVNLSGSTNTAGTVTLSVNYNGGGYVAVPGASFSLGANGTWTFNYTPSATGTYLFKVTEGAVTKVIVVEVHSATDTTIALAATNDTGASAADLITNDATVSGTAAPNATVELYYAVDDSLVVDVNGDPITITADGSGNWSYTDVNAQDGVNSYYAISGGNTSGTIEGLCGK